MESCYNYGTENTCVKQLNCKWLDVKKNVGKCLTAVGGGSCSANNNEDCSNKNCKFIDSFSTMSGCLKISDKLTI